MHTTRYRLALDLGSTSIGWAVLRLNDQLEPTAVIRSGVRIFSDGRHPKTGASLAVDRRLARAMRRRRDRLLKRKHRMMCALLELGYFPQDTLERKALERLDPYVLRAKGLDHALSPGEFARALFHINQRRGFKSNRKTDSKENDSGALKKAINTTQQTLAAEGCRTVGEWLARRQQSGQGVRARLREQRITTEQGKTKLDKHYELYVDRAMVAAEFDALWAKQAQLQPTLFPTEAGQRLKDVLLFQRNLRPVIPGRCTLLPDEPRAPLALPSQQRFRTLQEVANLRVLNDTLQERALTLDERQRLTSALEQRNLSFASAIPKLLGLPGGTEFNLADVKRKELKGNATSLVLARKELFGPAWHDFELGLQDQIVTQLLEEQSEAALIDWLQAHTHVDEACAERIANAKLPEGYGSLSAAALAHILPVLAAEAVGYAQAAQAAGFHHSRLSGVGVAIPGRTLAREVVVPSTGEIQTLHVFTELPYYGEFLQRHVGFADLRATEADPPEKRFGRIANPTVHIGLNQVRRVVNALIRRYGHPTDVVVELARELKQSRDARLEAQKQQAQAQDRNARHRATVAQVLGIEPNRVSHDDLLKLRLWEELNPYNAADRCCPYTGEVISMARLLSPEVEIEHILPFSRTLDDSAANKTLALRSANRLKGNQTPFEAFGAKTIPGYDYQAMLARAATMPRNKGYRFAPDGMQRWEGESSGFLARALNDTRYLSRVAREYLELICPQRTRVIPGQMTAMLRGLFGLNTVLGVNGEKNRDDHRHHAVDACVIGVTDQGMLQRFAQANASARADGLQRLVRDMPLPWPTYREHVARAVQHIWVSHKPDHSHEGAMHNDTAYALLGNGRVAVHKPIDGKRVRVEEALTVIPMVEPTHTQRHGRLPDGSPRPYKGYKGDSNHCIDIVRDDKGRWQGEVISTFEAYQAARQGGLARLRDAQLSLSGKPLVMRLMIGDTVRLKIDGGLRTMRVATVSTNGQIYMCDLHEANVDARNRNKSDSFAYISKMAGSLQKAMGRKVTVSPIGEITEK
ncbi:type II CRISPR RNA-guided endonuclease Cas9 [Roseateles sp. BYS180W]|uniref:CRISPR-associated endonuclease Cas9 n=1 Tax=Roseateles rivi TaxID=3299028 RepID=A0ABW7FT56_9BURK